MKGTPNNGKRLAIFGFCVGAISLFMYFSFIAKVALKGP